MESQKGTLSRWIDDKGFGFIKPDSGGNDLFIHISALRGMSRKPVIGDIIHYQPSFGTNGKPCAINAKIEGVSQLLTLTPLHTKQRSEKPNHSAKKSNINSKSNSHRSSSSVSAWKIILIVLLVGIIFTNFTKHKFPNILTETPLIAISKPEQHFECQGKVHCSQMTSSEEAEFYLQNCPGTKMDGDNDGIPCEQQF